MKLSEKIKKTLNIGAIAFVGLFGVGLSLVANGVQIKTLEKEHYVVVNAYSPVENKPYAFQFSAYELNNYKFTNLANYYRENKSQLSHDIRVFYNNYDSYITGGGSTTLTFDDLGDYRLYFYYATNNYGAIGEFALEDFNEGTPVDFEYNLVFDFDTLTDSQLSDIRNAIDLDVRENFVPTPSNWLTEIVSLLTGGIVGISSGVGTGVSTLVGDIFISNGALSTFGGILVAFAGISLAIGLCRWVMNFLTSLGAKK